MAGEGEQQPPGGFDPASMMRDGAVSVVVGRHRESATAMCVRLLQRLLRTGSEGVQLPFTALVSAPVASLEAYRAAVAADCGEMWMETGFSESAVSEFADARSSAVRLMRVVGRRPATTGRCGVVLDGCFSTLRPHRSGALRRIYCNKRCYDMDVVVEVPPCMARQLPTLLWSNVDYLFVLQDSIEAARSNVFRNVIRSEQVDAALTRYDDESFSDRDRCMVVDVEQGTAGFVTAA